MKFTNIISMLALIAGIDALAVPGNDTPIQEERSIEARGNVAQCRNTGPGNCAVITFARISAAGLPAGDTGWSAVAVVNGDCNTIKSSGTVTAAKPGWRGHLYTVYGPYVDYYASSIGPRNIRGIQFAYRSKSYYQSGCFGNAKGSAATFIDAVQCNFPC